MRPLARWQLMMALTLSVPCADWFTPCEKQVTVLAWHERDRRSAPHRRAAGGCLRRCRKIRRDGARLRQRVFEAFRMRIDVAIIERTEIGEIDQQAAEQRHVHSRSNRKMEIGILRGAVRRGSMTTILAPRSRLFSTMRWNSTG